MHIHILGICGTFMAGIARLASDSGHRVTGSDQHTYPPMSTQLQQAGIEVINGYDPSQLQQYGTPDIVIIGNALSRGNPVVEAVLDQGLHYTSGPQWLAENVLRDRWVLAVAGTHGKTTTTSLLAWMLDYAGLAPGFLIGGIAHNFTTSARLGNSPFFVIEADEYDTAFFDKRSKFVHYHPRTLILNNLEYDHADIFPDLAAIQQQFHHLIRTVPSQGLLVVNALAEPLQQVLAKGCWTTQETFALATQTETADWLIQADDAAGTRFSVHCQGNMIGQGAWSVPGEHNLLNALAAMAAARHVGIPPNNTLAALNTFKGVKRRLEVFGKVADITVYDDFAHHPTAIAATLTALRKQVGAARIISVLELRSNTMRMGIHNAELLSALTNADQRIIYQAPATELNLGKADNLLIASSIDAIIQHICALAESGDHILIMSNGGFGGIHQRLLDALSIQTVGRISLLSQFSSTVND